MVNFTFAFFEISFVSCTSYVDLDGENDGEYDGEG